MMRVRPWSIACLLLVGVMTLLPARASLAGGDWNDKEVHWLPYEEGLAAARKEKKPVCLVFFTEWCPHCQNYSGVFHDPKVVEKTKQFVMVRVDNDKGKDVSQQYAPDGQYIPRTYFPSPAGKLDASIHAPRDKFLYFYDEKNPAGVLAGMDEALKKFSPTSP